MADDDDVWKLTGIARQQRDSLPPVLSEEEKRRIRENRPAIKHPIDSGFKPETRG